LLFLTISDYSATNFYVMPKRNGVSTDHLYLQVADGIEKMIGEEILRIGDKLPSVRMLSEEYGISMGTAFQAYYHLAKSVSGK
jgi:DNA-binding transcriptional regulator YhcF (GntR family)